MMLVFRRPIETDRPRQSSPRCLSATESRNRRARNMHWSIWRFGAIFPSHIFFLWWKRQHNTHRRVYCATLSLCVCRCLLNSPKVIVRKYLICIFEQNIWEKQSNTKYKCLNVDDQHGKFHGDMRSFSSSYSTHEILQYICSKVNTHSIVWKFCSYIIHHLINATF